MDRPRPVQETNPEAPLGLVAIIAKLHAKDPAQRFQTAAEVAELLGNHLAELQQPTGLRSPLAPKRRWRMAAAALLLLAVGLGLLEAVGVTRLVPALEALHRTVPGPAQRSDKELPATAVVAPQAEGRPQLLTPAEGALLSNGALDKKKERLWEFRWAAVAGASRYHLHVIGPTATMPLINNPNLTVPSYRFTETGYATTTALSGWRWKVRAMVNREWAEWSEERSFDVEPPGPPSDANPPAAAPTLAALKQGGFTAFGFPQAQATVLCDTADLRVSFWNNRTYLYVQAILWKDGDDALVQAADGKLIGDTSTVLLDVDADGKITPQVDRHYCLNAWPHLQGLTYTFYNNMVATAGLKRDTMGRGAIRYLPTADGARVRVDSLVIPLAEINKRPGDKIRLAYWGASPKPKLTLNSVGFQRQGSYYPYQLPWDKFHEVTLADRADAFDPQAVPDGRDDPYPLMKPATRPFVLLARDGRAEQSLETLAEAARLARGGDTIEVRGNGPFPLPPISITDLAVRIRAGEGFRPVFHVGPERTELVTGTFPNGSRSYARGVLVSNSLLVLEGLEFLHFQTGSDTKPPTYQPTIIAGSGPLFVANCRFTGSLCHKLLEAVRSRRCELCNCQLIGGMALVVSHESFSRSVLRNNLIVPQSPVAVGGPSVAFYASPTANLHLSQNTLIGHLMLNREYDRDEPAAPVAGAPQSLRIEASANIFDANVRVLAPIAWVNLPKKVERPAELVQQWARWTGDHNLFPNARLYIQNGNAKDPRLLISTGLADWKQFWGAPETDSVEGRRPRYLGGDVLDKAYKTPEQVRPEDFRLHPESAGRGAGRGGLDVGADVDLVGPGPAYERWKKTPEYQDWLKVTEQMK
jgi:hypothetical protein